MLILVAVTINIAVNGGLFEYAGRAARDTETKKQEEQDFANLKANAKMPKGTYAKGDVYEWQKKYIFWLQNSTNNKEIM